MRLRINVRAYFDGFFAHFSMHKCLSAERSYINVETEPRTYLCGGGGGSCWGGGQLGGVTKLFFRSWHGMAWQNILGVDGKFGGGGMRWHNIFGGKVPKHFGGGVFRSPPTAAPCVTWV